ncbi:MAG TPA: gamma-butyrobetaine hydroxylase-like domain-containing protein [Methylomirabilota bacterium]|jgi:DUF971 family protein|nr:gamma-butyrobetaine hydroxylase-like domain-containing protein [Methylomirabilota bacterium]
MPGPRLPLLGADPNRPRELALVGRYALGVTWEDGHKSIYPYEALRAACPCGACRPDGAPPREIHREPSGLRVVWPDGHAALLEGAALRARCPCAQCTAAPPPGRP